MTGTGRCSGILQPRRLRGSGFRQHRPGAAATTCFAAKSSGITWRHLSAKTTSINAVSDTRSGRHIKPYPSKIRIPRSRPSSVARRRNPARQHRHVGHNIPPVQLPPIPLPLQYFTRGVSLSQLLPHTSRHKRPHHPQQPRPSHSARST